MKAVDVIMCTWNSNRWFFPRVLESVKRNIPVNNLIVVDRFSRDGTVEAVKSRFPDAVVIRTEARLGRARAIGISHVSTEYFMFVDSDVEVPRGYFEKLLSLREHAGVSGYGLPWWKWRGVGSGRAKVVLTKENPDRERACTGASLVLTDAARGWDPPKWLAGLEDHHLARYVVGRGYTWCVVRDLYTVHYVSRLESVRRNVWDAANYRAIGFDGFNLRRLALGLLASPLQAVVTAVKEKDPHQLWYLPAVRAARLWGYLFWNRYMEYRRC